MEITENKIVNSIKEIIKDHKKIFIGILISICMILGIYFGLAIYFMNHFYFGTTINCINVSGKSVSTVNEIMDAELGKYALNLKERGGKNEQIEADEIDLRYDSGEGFEDSKEKQNHFKWVLGIFNKENTELVEKVKFNNKLLNDTVEKLACFDSNKVIEPKNPSFKYTNKGYMIVSEINGNKVDKYILNKYLIDAILNNKTSIDLESIKCYVKPEYTSSSQKVIDTKNLINKYVSSKITYTFGNNEEILDGAIINEWITVDENMKVNLDEKKIQEYIETIAGKYNTVGATRDFVTSSGNKIKISGGDYGWTIDKVKEAQSLTLSIKAGEIITKEPIYTQTALCRDTNDIGSTYVEINLASQYLWFYKNGSLISEGPVVTGSVSSKHTTPQGIYILKYKQKNVVLKGADYEAPVTFWMPFNGGIGIHDASWRSSFGGTIYKTSGSHGCINSPYYLAKELFNNIESGIPVICY